MATGILASLAVEIGAEISGFQRGVAQAKKELAGLVKAGEAMKSIGQSLSLYVSAPLVAVATLAVGASGKIESLRNGLQAIATQELGKQGVTGLQAISQAAQQTTARMTELEVLARQPGLGFEEAVKGDVRLRAVGITAEQSAKSISAFANAIATTGGGKNEFDRVTVQLAQLSAKGKVLAQDLRPIIEAAPAVSGALQKLYGTVDSETISASLAKQGQSSTDFIRVLTDELGKLPQVTGSLKNGLENFQDTLTLSLAKIGDGISKSLNLPAVLASLSDGVSGLADVFTSLSPGAQTAIVALAGLAAATGPVLVALGSLAVGLPYVKAGFVLVQSAATATGGAFASLLTPAGAVVAVLVTLAAVVYAAATANERAYRSFEEQSAATRKLSTDLTPLLDRYDELKAKTTLSAAEQAEMKGIIEQVTAVLPDAGKGFDNYGKAIELNTGKARAFIAQNQELDRTIALKSLPAQLEQLKELQAEYDRTAKRRDEVTSKGTFNGASIDVLGTKFLLEFREQVSNTTIALEAQKKRVADLQTAINGLGSEYEDASVAGAVFGDSVGSIAGGLSQQVGLLAELEDRLKALREAKPDLTSEGDIKSTNQQIAAVEAQIKRLNELGIASKGAETALSKLRAELRVNGQLRTVLGESYAFLEERQKILTKGIKDLLEGGYTPASAAVRKYAAELQMLNNILGDNQQLKAPTVLIATSLSSSYQPPAKLDTLPVPDLTPLELVVKRNQELYAQMTGTQREAFRESLQMATEFNTGMESILVGGLTDVATGIGEAIGQMASNAGGIELVGAALLAGVGGMAVQLGQLAIGIGIATLGIKAALESLNPVAAIAGGIALVALGTLAKGAASRISAGGGGTAVPSGGGSSFRPDATATRVPEQRIKIELEPVTFRQKGPDLSAVVGVNAYRRLRLS